MASDFEIFSAAGTIYAESMLQLAQKAGQSDAVGEELSGLAELWRRDPAFAAMMSSVAIDINARRESIRKIFTGKAAKFVERVDPAAMGGLAVQIGDSVYDFSARRRIADMRKSLMNSVQR